MLKLDMYGCYDIGSAMLVIHECKQVTKSILDMSYGYSIKVYSITLVNFANIFDRCVMKLIQLG